MECLNQTGTTALQKILCPTYQSCGTYCQQDCMSYGCSSTYTAITRRTYVSSATLFDALVLLLHCRPKLLTQAFTRCCCCCCCAHNPRCYYNGDGTVASIVFEDGKPQQLHYLLARLSVSCRGCGLLLTTRTYAARDHAGNYYYYDWNYYWNRQRLTTWTFSNYDLSKPSSTLFGPGFPCAPGGISDSV